MLTKIIEKAKKTPLFLQDRFVPEYFDKDDRRRGNLIIAFTLITAVVFPPYMVTHYLMGDLPGAVVVFVVWALYLLTPMLIKRFGVVVASTFPLLLLYSLTTYFVVMQGGLDSPTVVPKIITSVIATMLIGIKGGVLWLGIETATFLVIGIMEYFDFPFPQTVPPEWYHIDRFSQLLGMLIVSAGLFILSERERVAAQAGLEEEMQRTDRLLLNILPERIANLIKSKPNELIAERFDNASVLFADLTGFTHIASAAPPELVVTFLNDYVSAIDRAAMELNVEKIKTIGDSYMAVCGVPAYDPRHAEKILLLGKKILAITNEISQKYSFDIKVRIGIHCGTVVAGVIGTTKFAYDLWGDTVNTASRMESYGEAGKIHITSEFREQLLKTQTSKHLIITEREAIVVKGKGTMNTYFVE